MAHSIPAMINPRMLVWARESAGYDVQSAASRLHISLQQLSEWECGASRPSYAKLEDIARVYNRPPAVYYLKELPTSFALVQDHRRLPGASAPYSPELIYQLQKARDRREVLLELLSYSRARPAVWYPKLTQRQKPDVLAELLRTHLGLTAEMQRACKSDRDAFAMWAGAVEDAGALVFQTRSRSGVSIAEMRGTAIYYEPLPVIVINGKDAWTAKSFSLLHEVAHVCLQSEGVCDPHAVEPTDDQSDMEAYCNEVAACVLMPRDAFLAALAVVEAVDQEIGDSQIERLAGLFHVSRESVVRRLLSLGAVSPTFYRTKRAEYQEQFDRLASKANEEFRRSPKPYVAALRENGLTYSVVVLDALGQRYITLRDASAYLDLRLKWLNGLREAVNAAVLGTVA